MTKPDPLLPEPADPLGETLHMLRLTGTLYCRGEFTAPFAIEIPELDGVMTFLVVTSGRCWLEVRGAEPRLLKQGSLALIPHGVPHIISSDPNLPADPLFDLPIEKISDRYECMRHGGGGALTSTMYGVLRFDDVAAQHLLRLLPQTIHIDGWNNDARQHSTKRGQPCQFISNYLMADKTGYCFDRLRHTLLAMRRYRLARSVLSGFFVYCSLHT